MDDVLFFDDTGPWEDWLAGHHDHSPGVWLQVTKKGSGKSGITAAEAGDVALCFGWIDSHRRALDQDYFLQRYSRRRANGSWSRVNTDRAEALIAAGRMRPPGLAEVNAAKADGRWQAAYESQRHATVPPELAAALDEDPSAASAFARLSKTERYTAMLPLLKARTPQARQNQLRRLLTALTTD